ncbi:pyridoxamine 5'-phosphate oxidase family protein [Streptacidiphilus monticola]|uniref:Pyridoxamine 5'-phosphate oxidase family protein n=1 Tax=Streptacidiphilus monticola TaxID=2161674 RepID=A0ABW1FVM3_9ACTN
MLGSVSYGRVVLSHQALPAIGPVNHLLADGCVVIRTRRGAALLGPGQDGAVVAFEADALDPAARSGWSVVVAGVPTLVSDPEELRRYQRELRPWMGCETEHMVRFSADRSPAAESGDGAEFCVRAEN